MSNLNIKRLVYSDIDGTIYNFPDKKMHPDAIKDIITTCQENNIDLIINTGNGAFKKVQNIAKTLKAKYLIIGNGSGIFDLETQKYLKTFYIPIEEAKKVFNVAKKLNGELYYISERNHYLYNVSDYVKKFLTTFNEVDFNSWIEDGSIPTDLLKIEFDNNEKELKKIYKELLKMDLNLEIVFLGSHIEITAKNITKGSGIDWLNKNIFQAKNEFVMAIGDSENDLSMFEIAGFSYAMDNSPIHVKKQAKYFTSDVLQNGLAEAINDYVFRTRFDIERSQLEQKFLKQKEHNKY